MQTDDDFDYEKQSSVVRFDTYVLLVKRKIDESQLQLVADLAIRQVLHEIGSVSPSCQLRCLMNVSIAFIFVVVAASGHVVEARFV